MMTQFFSFSLITLLAISCQVHDPNDATLEFELPKLKAKNALMLKPLASEEPTAPYAPGDISGFDCVLVNVVGEGIGEWDANSDKVGVGRNFSYVGSISKMVSALTGGVVELQIKKGSLRYIQLIGVRSTIGCPANVKASDLNSFDKFPGMFIIGSVKKDIFKSETVTIKSTYSVTSAADFRASEDEPRPSVDKEAPTPGSSGLLEVTSESADNATITWSLATDDGTLAKHLEYKLVTASISEDINTVDEVSEMTGDGVVMDWSANTSSDTATGLDPALTHYFALAVKDYNGNMALYQLGYQAPTCSCGPGYYLGDKGCVAAEIGYWASSCTRYECSNKPANSSYSGTATTTSSCSWSCDTGYAPNADYTSCVSLGDSTPVGCSGTEVVVGFNIRSGGWIDKLGVRCQNYNAGKPTGAVRDGTSFGGEGGSPATFDCANGEAINAIQYINITNVYGAFAGSIRFQCKDPLKATPSSWSSWYGAGEGGSSEISCGDGAFFNWMAITASGGYAGPISGQFGCI